MTDKEKIKELLEASPDGTITAEQVTSAGLHRSILQELVGNGELYRFGRGLYVCSNAWEDDFYLSIGAGYTRMIPRCIYWAILTVPRRSTL